MDLIHLRYFIAVAERLHFGKAAVELGIAQSALSQAIQRLEKKLDTRLLDRSRRAVSLTMAGRTLLEEARRIVAQTELAERMTRRAAHGHSPLRVAFAPWAAMQTLPRALRGFQKKWPGVEVRLDERLSRRQVEGLLDGSIDLGILSRREASTEGLEVKVIERAKLMVALPTAWPLARKRTVHLADLAELPFVMFPQAWGPNLSAAIDAACRAAGFVPNVTQRVAQPYTALNLVAHELGIALVPASARHMKMDAVTLKPVAGFADDPWFEFALAWVPRAVSPAMQDFIGLVEANSRKNG